MGKETFHMMTAEVMYSGFPVRAPHRALTVLYILVLMSHFVDTYYCEICHVNWKKCNINLKTKLDLCALKKSGKILPIWVQRLITTIFVEARNFLQKYISHIHVSLN